MIRIGLNSPTQGFTERAAQAAFIFGPKVMRWLSSSRPEDALRCPADCVHILRLDNWQPNESAADYLSRISARITQWRDVPNLVANLGNEPNLEAGHNGERFPEMAATVRAAFPGILVANPPLSTEATGLLSPAVCAATDYIMVNCYWGFEAPAFVADPAWGRNYLPLLAYGKDVYISEVNASPANKVPTSAADWHERNRQVAQWIAQADSDGVQGCCIFLADGAGQWSGYDVGPDAAIDIRAQIPVPPPPPPPPPPPVTAYGFAAVDAGQFTGMVRDGSMAGMTSPFLDQYPTITDAARQSDLDVRVLLAWTRSENNQATNISADLLAAHNAAGIYYVGQRRATPGPLGPASEGGKPYCAFATWTDFWLTLADNIAYVLGVAGGDLNRAAWYYTLGTDGYVHADAGEQHPKARYYAEYESAYPPGGVTPAPSPTPATGITLGDIQRIAATHIGNTRTAEGNPEYGMCEQFVEEVLQEAGLPRVRFGTAAQHATLLQGQGALHTEMPPPAGAVLWWLPPFDPSGHTCIADSYPDVLTTYPGAISRIDAAANGWYAASGFAGWWIPDGVSETPTQEVDVLVQGHLDGAMIERLWYGAATAAARKKMGWNPDSAIGDRWKKELLAGRPLGAAQSGEETDTASGRKVQYFTNGAITYLIATGETFVN